MNIFLKIKETLFKAKYEHQYILENLPNYLKGCPVHRWRAINDIELIHKEPDLKELKRIWKNWNLMTDEQKEKSEKKSEDLFGMTNEKHYQMLLKDYEK